MKKYILGVILLLLPLGAQAQSVDVDKDGKVDGYDTYLTTQINLGKIPANIVFPVRNFTLDTLNKFLDQSESSKDTDSELYENSSTGKLIKKWKTKFEKKGHMRATCEPPMLNVTFDKFDSRGKPKELFNGFTTYQDYTQLQYQKIRMVGNCDVIEDYFGSESSLGFNGQLNVQLRDYIVYKIFRMFNISSPDVVSFANMSFRTADPKYEGKTYPYMFLQRDNEQDDQIPFTRQFGLNPTLIEDGKWDKWQSVWGGNLGSGRFFSVNYKDVVQNKVNNIRLDPENSIRYFIMTDFLKVEDRSILHNEDYGQKIGEDKWRTIPYGFDLGFSGCKIDNPAKSIIMNEIDQLPNDLKNSYKALYYNTAIDIFGNGENLYKMLLAVDRFPFSVDKSKLKSYLKIAFYKYSKYYTSDYFAKSLNQKYVSINVQLPFKDDDEAKINEDSLLNSCVRKYETPPNVNTSVKTSALSIDSDKLRIVYDIDLVSSEADLLLSKSSLFRIDLISSTESKAEFYAINYSKPSELIDQPGPFYILPRGVTAHFHVTGQYYINENTTGDVYTQLTHIWLGPKYGQVSVPENKTNTVTLTPSVSSTISSVNIPSDNPGTINKWKNYNINWQGTNLRRVNIDLYDLKGIYKNRTIEQNYKVPFSKESQIFNYNWYIDGDSLPDDIYKIKITDALDKNIKSLSDKISIQDYQIPSIGTAQVVGTSTVKLVLAPGGRESLFKGTFNIKINATTDNINIPSNYGFYTYAKRISPEDKPGEYSSMYASVFVESVTGDFSKVEDSKEGTLYKIQRGKSATFKVISSFKPEQMFAGQYRVIVNSINVSNSQNKRANIVFDPFTSSNSVTILGERSPYILSINNPINVNSVAIIEGERFSDISNNLIIDDKTYNLPGAKDGKISFYPEKVGLASGQYWFQIDSPNGKSNYEWLNIKPALTGANVFTAFWNLLKSMF